MLKTDHAHISMATITLINADLERFEIPEFDIDLLHDEVKLHRCHLSFAVPHESYARLEEEGWFNLSPEAKLEPGSDQFDAEKLVKLTLRLDKKLIPELDMFSEQDAFEAAAHISTIGVQEDFDEPMVHETRWFLVSATQAEAPGLESGYRTIWDEELTEA